MIEGYIVHRAVLSPEVLAQIWDYLLALPFTRIERPAMHLSRSLQDDNTGNEQARYLVGLLKQNGMDQFIAFDDVSVVRYDCGADYVDWHSDGGPLLEPGCAMGVLSLGQSRAMELRRKDDEAAVESVTLNAGDLIVSREGFQLDHQHRIPPIEIDGIRMSIVLFTHAKKKRK